MPRSRTSGSRSDRASFPRQTRTSQLSCLAVIAELLAEQRDLVQALNGRETGWGTTARVDARLALLSAKAGADEIGHRPLCRPVVAASIHRVRRRSSRARLEVQPLADPLRDRALAQRRLKIRHQLLQHGRKRSSGCVVGGAAEQRRDVVGRPLLVRNASDGCRRRRWPR